MSQFPKFFRLSSAQRRLVLEAAALLGVSRAAIVFLPFKTVARILGNSDLKIKERAADFAIQPPQIEHIAWAVRRVGRRTPWRSNCLAKAVAGKIMLRRRHISSTIYFGVKKNSEGEILAHAWLKCEGEILTGGSNLDQYSVVASFSD